MKNLQAITTSFIFGSLALTSCSTSQIASTSAQDNLYFMASDAKIATEFAVQNNQPESFQNLASENSNTYSQENFSSRNVNPDYIAKYQSDPQVQDEGTVYFDEIEEAGTVQNINAYNNYSVNGSRSGFNNGFNSAFSLGLGMGFGFGGYGMGGFYDPFFNPFFGYGSGFRMNLGFGWGSPFMGMGFGMGYPMYGMGFGMGYPMYGMGYPMYGMGYPMYGYPGFGNPIYILPGGEYGDRNVVVGARPTRGASLAGAGYRGNSSSAAIPSTARAQARNEAMGSNATNRRVVSSSENSRISSRDFSTSQNDYYSNSRSRVASGITRNVNSPAVDRGSITRSRSAMPTSRPTTSVGGTNSRSSGNIYTPNRSTSSPSYNRSTSPSYNRSTAPSYNQRSTSPTYNRNTTPSRSNNNSPSFNAPSRSSSSPSYSAPSRSSGGSTGGSSGGSTSGGSRSGRGN